MTKSTSSAATADRLEEAILRLTQNQAQLTSNQQDLSKKIYSIPDQLVSLDPSSVHPPLPPPPPPTYKPHMKLEVLGF